MKVAIVVLADTETHAGMGRIANALESVKEFKEANDEVQLLFDGASTKWGPELAKPDNAMNRNYTAVKEKITGACRYCAVVFGVKESVQSAGILLLGEFEGHPSLRKLVSQGYQVITF